MRRFGGLLTARRWPVPLDGHLRLWVHARRKDLSRQEWRRVGWSRESCFHECGEPHFRELEPDRPLAQPNRWAASSGLNVSHPSGEPSCFAHRQSCSVAWPNQRDDGVDDGVNRGAAPAARALAPTRTAGSHPEIRRFSDHGPSGDTRAMAARGRPRLHLYFRALMR